VDSGEIFADEKAEEGLDVGQDAASVLGSLEAQLGGVVAGGEFGKAEPSAHGVQPVVSGNIFGLKVVEVLEFIILFKS